jgi:uncharacterized protein (TIGR02466 family)
VSGTDAAAALERVTALLQSGDAAAALPLLREAMQALPANAPAAFRAGTAAFLLGDHDAAADCFELATRRQPGWVEAWNNLAASLARLQEFAAAIDAGRTALRLAPDRAASCQALATLLSNQFDQASLQEGLQLAAQVLRADPQAADSHRTCAVLLRKLGDPERAEWHARRALALSPDDPEMVDTLGDLLLQSGKADAAVQVYRIAAERGLATQALRRQLGVALLQAGRVEAAAAALRPCVDAQARDQRAIAYYGAALAALGDVTGAQRLLGVNRHVHAVSIPAPPEFADDATFRATLADDIRRHSQQRWEPPGLAARNAYLSGDLLADRTPAIQAFERALRDAIANFLAACVADPGDVFLRNIPAAHRIHVWATQASERGFIDTHIHEESWLSGAYYVELPAAVRADDPAQAGWIEFGRPFSSLPPVADGLVRRMCPQPGTLLLFPSYLFHRTLPYSGPGERISISFDLAAR